MTLLLPGSARDFEAWTGRFAPLARHPVDQLLARVAARAADGGTPLKDEVLRYREYLEWPVRQMEYSYVILALSRYAARWQPAPILDVGCGPSSFPAVLASAFGARVTAVDSDPRIAEEMGRLDLPGCEYRQADMRALPFPDRTFAAVTSVSVLEHAPREWGVQAIEEMLRVVRPDGCVVLTLDYRGLGPGGLIARLPDRIRRGLRLLATGGLPSFARGASAPRPYAWKDLDDLRRHFRGQIVGGPERAWARLSLRRIREFWTAHWQPGFHYDRQTGRDYTSVGVILSPDPEVRKTLADMYPEAE